jgi:hypothetical protein
MTFRILTSFNRKVKIDMWIQKNALIWFYLIKKNQMMHLRIKCIEIFFKDFWKKFNILLSSFINPFLIQNLIFLHGFLSSICLAMCTFGVAISFISNISKCTLNA